MWRKIKKLRFWWKTLVIFDTSNMYTTYAKHKKIFKFKDYFNFVKNLIEKLLTEYSKRIKRENIYLFVWIDENLEKSKWFYQEVVKLLSENKVISKKVKYFNVKWQLKRKADLDADIWFYLWKLKDKFTSFLIFSSDGDFAGIYKELLSEWKQVVVLHWYISEKEYKQYRKKRKLKNYNIWREILELQKIFPGYIFVHPIDILFEN